MSYLLTYCMGAEQVKTSKKRRFLVYEVKVITLPSLHCSERPRVRICTHDAVCCRKMATRPGVEKEPRVRATETCPNSALWAAGENDGGGKEATESSDAHTHTDVREEGRRPTKSVHYQYTHVCVCTQS